MDLDDDIMDAYDGCSGGEDYSAGENDDCVDDDDAMYSAGENDDSADDDEYDMTNDDLGDREYEKTYTVLKEFDIKQRQEESISHISDILSMPRVAANTLLCHYKWNESRLAEEWFSDEERVRKAVGLVSKPTVELPNAKELTCGICFDSIALENTLSATCGHRYCRICWESYVTISINDGPGCLLLRCPHPSCRGALGQDMISDLASDDDKKKFYKYLIRSYVEEKKKVRWCPAPDCDNALEYNGGDICEPAGSKVFEVRCLCSHMLCWNCNEEAHSPVDCATVSKWVLKNGSEAENLKWILANSKACPKCKRPIEKNHGCMHMTCTPPCRFQFCWLCLGPWSEHGSKTGGNYSCNRYEAAKQGGLHDEEEIIRERAKNSLERYMHYYERWQSNDKSKAKAIEDLHQMQTGVDLAKLSEKLKEPESQLKFIVEAWQQIIECRRFLKWTYAYGYYFPRKTTAKLQFFEYLQGEAEAGLERLHLCAEKELSECLQDESIEEAQALQNFKSFRPKLAGLTKVTRSYFQNLVTALVNGLADVKSQRPCSNSVTTNKQLQ